MDSPIDYTSPSAQFTFDVNKNPFFTKDNFNFMNIIGIEQLNTLDNLSLIDIFLSRSNNIEPHYHPNASELVYCISGAMAVSILNPFTKQYQHYTITPGQVANIPQGWWHYQMATEDRTHALAIFNASTPEVILGSDILRLTPSNIMAHTYCMDENQWRKAIKPITASTYIGPPKNCHRNHGSNAQAFPNYIYPYGNQGYPMQPYTPYNHPRC
ncbi:cupin domain-containing protein [Psychrobacillus lasiicapitis]|uniref:Cupin domain-containing protein n=1 Tax=Psychrobacillus lasiicapitis TaxID=1636719 RepID=A0A544SWM7_9BACI|nr:cupin domain-containing protein [Psychrobacillus lasiicapitis]TQR09612.1 cupin domain-containing protein [Psychrobacillus lasiicapitis]GGA29021.1 cupin [Psychrobacillus lasiicapitis]